MTSAEIETSITDLEGTLLETFDGHWTGKLSSSALATAVAIFALDQVDGERFGEAISDGIRWLDSHINNDGGWGDCPSSQSNLSTTLLVWSALSQRDEALADRAAVWIEQQVGSLDPTDIVEAVLDFYDDDRTFSAPILFMSARAGRLGAYPYSFVPQLPFELAVFPHEVFRFLRLPVVSYAIPALVAIGMGRYFAVGRHGLRGLLRKRMMQVLETIQPSNGGFLEAAPLTAFVVLGLVAAEQKEHGVVHQAIEFLLKSQRPDGSWPIDSNLATWVSTLAVDALRPSGDEDWTMSPEDRHTLREWLLDQQFNEKHQFTHAAPGGWAWTNLPGAVPDADDTSGVLVALHTLEGPVEHAERACSWLLEVQNRDGGIPTFCKGWGRLPFDRSCPDITAHAIRAWTLWQPRVSEDVQRRIDKAVRRALCFLAECQRTDGAWIPLWFGNQGFEDQVNPVYGTARVVLGLQTVNALEQARKLLHSGCRWLTENQNTDGGWGESTARSSRQYSSRGRGGAVPSGVFDLREAESYSTVHRASRSEKTPLGAVHRRPQQEIGEKYGLTGGSSIEETALALHALSFDADPKILKRGTAWLIEHRSAVTEAEPIGLYFASLWYSEQMYPVVFSLAALKSVKRRFSNLTEEAHR